MTAMKQIPATLHARTRRLSAVHLLYVLTMVGQIIIFDSGKLIPPEVVLQRWLATAVFAAIVTAIWYASRDATMRDDVAKRLLGSLVVADIAIASVNVYTQRGMASRAVMLYAIPIIVAAAINRQSAIMASAVLSAAAYLATCVAYFVLHFNEGYKLELYGEAGFYAAIFIILSLGLWSVVKPKQ